MIAENTFSPFVFTIWFVLQHQLQPVTVKTALDMALTNKLRAGCRSDFNELPVVFCLSHKLFNSHQFTSALYHVFVFTSYFNEQPVVFFLSHKDSHLSPIYFLYYVFV